MNSRMEKHGYSDTEKIPRRTEKNQELYHNINRSDISRIKANSNVTIIDDAPKKIDIDKIKKYVNSLEDQVPVSRRVMIDKENLKEEIIEKEIKEEPKIYDINSVLEKAKEGRELYYENEKYKKLKNTQYDILNKIDLAKEEDELKEEIEFNTDERTLIDLINTVTIHKKEKDLLSELTPSSNEPQEEVTSPISEMDNDEIITKEIKEEPTQNTEKEEIIKEIENANTISQNIDKSFYTNSMNFTKSDFEGFEELEKNVKKNSVLVKFGIVLLILLGIITAYIIIKYIL